MRPGFIKLTAWFIAAVALGFSCLAQTHPVAPAAAPAPAEQPIIFSAPNGESVSNALLPSAQAPGTEELANLPADNSGDVFTPHLPVAPMPALMPVLMHQARAKDEDAMTAVREHMGLFTPEQIMNVPTVQDIFGLPKSSSDRDKQDGSQEDPNSKTNNMSKSEIDWSKVWSNDADQTALDSAKDSNSPDASSGFFDTSSGNGLFSNKSGSDSVFDDSPFGQTTTEPSPADVSAQLAADSTPADGDFSQKIVPMSAPVSSALSSQSPFALPKSSDFDTMPQLPTPATVAGQYMPQSHYTPPSWEPKPAPWLSTVPPLGTMEPRKF